MNTNKKRQQTFNFFQLISKGKIEFIIFQMFTNLVYFVIAVVIPLKHTYQALKSQEQTKQTTATWSIYWSLFAFIHLLKFFLPFLNIQTFQIVIILFLLWLYNDYFKGALYLKQNLTELCNQVSFINSIIESIKQLNLTFRILDDEEDKKAQ